MLEMICQLHHNFSLPKRPEGLSVHKFLMARLSYSSFHFDPIYFGAGDEFGSNWCIQTSVDYFEVSSHSFVSADET